MLHRSVLPGLRAESQARIDGTKTSHRYQRGQILHYQDNPCGGVHSIVTGRAKLVRASASGRRCILRIATPGDLLGLDALLSAGRTYSTTAQMLEAGIVSFVERDVVLDVIRADPSAAEAIFAMLAEWVHVADEERAELVGSGVRERTARVLVRLAKDHGVAVGAGLLVRPQLTREELAEMVGSAAETVTRQLTEFRESDLVQLDGRRIVVTDLERLTRVAHLADPLFPDEHHVVS
jgi:CRP/FNR family transcriptional regulator